MERHFTVTVYIIENGKVLLLLHPKFKKWLPPGGHLEANEIPPEGARREVLEETGLEIAFIKQENVWHDFWNATSFERPFSCLLENIAAHGDRPAHQHIDLIYLAKPTGGSLHSVAKWFSLADVENLVIDQDIFPDVKHTVRYLFKDA